MAGDNDWRVAGIDELTRLAELAPKDDKRAPPGQNGNRPADDVSSLGQVDLKRYLDHYNVVYKLVETNKTTKYVVDCVFDGSHRAPDAVFFQDPGGFPTYQCSHNSCAGRGWKEARAAVSGSDIIARFCEGYDPNWKGGKTKRAKNVNSTDEGKPPKVFVPVEGKPFLEINEKGRVRFNPVLLAEHLRARLDPLIYEGAHEGGDSFYRYEERGIWKFLPDDAVCQSMLHELGEVAREKWISESLKLLKHGAYKSAEELKADPMLLNLRTGMLDLRTMETKPHGPEYNSRVQLSINYSPEARCDEWLQAVDRIFADNPEKGVLLREFFGYCLYPKIIFPAILFQIGDGANGKGVVEKVLCAMLGDENVCHISLTRMQDNFGPFEIKDKLLNSSSETEIGTVDVAMFKKISAGDAVQAEVKYKNDVKFTPIAKHMISMNDFPGIKEKTGAFFRRVMVLEYKQKFEGESDRKGLADEIIANELDGVFLWALQGLRDVLERGHILIPDSVKSALQRFRLRTNNVLLFADEMCSEMPGVTCSPPDVYKVYKEWCEDGKLRPVSKHNFYEQVLLNCRSVERVRIGTRDVFRGICLLSSVSSNQNQTGQENVGW